MRRSAEFAQAFRGTRGGSARLMVAIGKPDAGTVADLHVAKVGFVVPKSVGNSVVRHRLYRQLRHIMRDRLDLLEPNEMVAIRVFPPARGASSSVLATDVECCILKVRNKQKRKKGK